MSSALVYSNSTAEAWERAYVEEERREEERINRLWEPVPVEVAPGDVDYKWRYRPTGEVVFQPDETLLSF